MTDPTPLEDRIEQIQVEYTFTNNKPEGVVNVAIGWLTSGLWVAALIAQLAAEVYSPDTPFMSGAGFNLAMASAVIGLVAAIANVYPPRRFSGPNGLICLLIGLLALYHTAAHP